MRTTTAALLTGLAAYLSLATIALTGTGVERVALLPPAWPSVAVAVAAAALAFLAARAGASLTPLALLGFVLLPWLPIPLPTVFLLWTGPIVTLLWALMFVAMLWAPVSRWLTSRRPWTARRSACAAGLVALSVYGVSAVLIAPALPGGDEPHYLVITQSLLLDHDLQIENNHARGDYHVYNAGYLPPDFIERGRNGAVYSIHAPGLPAVVLPAFALGGYYGVVVFLLLASAATSALAWWLAWRATESLSAAWFGWAAASLGVTSVFHAGAVYPDGFGSGLLLAGSWALLRARDVPGRFDRVSWCAHGVAIGCLPWFHTRYAALAGVLSALVALRLVRAPSGVPRLIAFLLPQVLSVAAWLTFFFVIYGTPSPLAPYGPDSIASARFVADGLAGLFFDQRFGLLAYTPVLAAAFAGLWWMIVGRASFPSPPPGTRRLALEIAGLAIPYLVLVTTYRMWWAGWSAPARLAMPLVPLLAIPAAIAWQMAGRTARTIFAGLLVTSLCITAALVWQQGGVLAYNVRTAPARWLPWLTPNVNLADGVPRWADRDPLFFREIAVWLLAFAAACWIVGRLGRRWRDRRDAPFATAAAAVFAIATTGAVAGTLWEAHALAGPQVSGQVALLRHVRDDPDARVRRQFPWTPDRSGTSVRSVRMRMARLPLPENGDPLRVALFRVADLPAGAYTLTVHGGGERGAMALKFGEQSPPFREVGPGAFDVSIRIDVPVDVDALVIEGDTFAADVARTATLEPLAVTPAAARISEGAARFAARYGTDLLFFLDARAFPEGDGFWTAGEATTAVAVAPSRPRDGWPLTLLNGGVPNRFTISAGAWRVEGDLAAGEERALTVPLDPAAAATRVTITSATGFRPADEEAGSDDPRFLGIRLIPGP